MTSMHSIGLILIIYGIDIVNFKRCFHGNGTSLQFHTSQTSTPKLPHGTYVYHLFEGEGGHQLHK